MEFYYDGRGNMDLVVDVYGREIRYHYDTFSDGRDRLVKIEDFIGRQVIYTYDERFDLVAVTGPAVTGTSTGNDFPEGRTERYVYSQGFADERLNHNITGRAFAQEVADFTAGAGAPAEEQIALRWTYGTDPEDPLTFDRVIARTRGGTNASGVEAGGTMTLSYREVNADAPLGDPTVPRLVTTHVDRKGYVAEYFFNERLSNIIVREHTRGLRADEPPFFETRMAYDNDGRLLQKILPEGNEIRYTYDALGPRATRSNLLEVRRIADSDRGGGEDLVTTMTYEPLYNRLASITGPRGNAAEFEPPLGTASAARYTRRYVFEYQEGEEPVPEAEEFGIDLSGISRGLGDLNGDGRTDQTAGNIVHALSPTVLLAADSNEAEARGSTAQEILTENQWNDHGQLLKTIDAEGNVTVFEYYPQNDPDGNGAMTFSMFRALSSADASGYLRVSIADAELSPRRTEEAPPAALRTLHRYDRVGNMVATVSPRGIVTTFEVNQLNEVVVVTRGAQITPEAVNDGQLLTGEAPFRYRTRMFYDHNGRVVRREVENRDSTTAEVGDFVDHTTTYDILHHVVERTVEIDGKTTLRWEQTYDENELLTLTIQPEGNQVLRTYDERDLPLTVTRGEGSEVAATVRYDYDLNQNLRRFIDAEDNDGDDQPEATLTTYDGFDRHTETVDALGNRTVVSYDVDSNAVRQQVFGHPAGEPGAANVLLADMQYRHDELNRVFQRDDALFLAEGFETERAVELLDEDSDGVVTTRYEYDALGRRTFVVEDDLEVTRTVYDGLGRVVESVDHLGNRTTIEYDRNSNPVRAASRELSPDGLVAEETFTTLYVYDQLDRLVRVTDNAGQTTRFDYDSRDNLVFQSDPEGPPAIDPLGLFPAAGQSGRINEAGNTRTWFYDGLDRRVRQVCDLRQGGVGGNDLDTSNPHNPDGQVTLAYVWDGNSRLAAIVDDNGNRTGYSHDELDRKTSQINADATSYRFAYDRDDNVRHVIDPNGSRVAKSYDVLNRLVLCEIDNTGAPGVGGTSLEAYEYDGLSRLTRSLDDNGTAARTQTCELVYDSLSRLLEERQNGQPVSKVFTGDGKRLRCTYPGGRSIVSTFDRIDRVVATSDGAGEIAAHAWIGPGYRELLGLRGNGTSLSFLDDEGRRDIGHDAVKRVVRGRCFLPGGAAFVDREYSYNRADQRTLERRHDDAGLTDSYAYDSIYRLVEGLFDQDGIAGAAPRDLERQSYRLDGVGNRRQVERRVTGADLTENYAVNEMNEYTVRGGVARVHDDNGNLVDDGARQLVYDYRNRLVAVEEKTTGRPIAEYLYYADARRARKIVYRREQPGEVEKETTYFYDGWQVCEEQDGLSGASEITCVWGPAYIDSLLQLERTAAHPLGAGTFYVHQNVRFDVVALTDGAGQVVETVRYDDFGNAESPSSMGNPYLFQGRRFDAETGFYYFRNRYYDPTAGRFLQRDPVWDAANVGNQYTFVANGPATRLDPSGELGPIGAGILGGAVFGGASALGQWLDKGCVDWGRVGTSFGMGFAFGAGFGWLGPKLAATTAGSGLLAGMAVTGAGVGGWQVGSGIREGSWEKGLTGAATAGFSFAGAYGLRGAVTAGMSGGGGAGGGPRGGGGGRGNPQNTGGGGGVRGGRGDIGGGGRNTAGSAGTGGGGRGGGGAWNRGGGAGSPRSAGGGRGGHRTPLAGGEGGGGGGGGGGGRSGPTRPATEPITEVMAPPRSTSGTQRPTPAEIVRAQNYQQEPYPPAFQIQGRGYEPLPAKAFETPAFQQALRAHVEFGARQRWAMDVIKRAAFFNVLGGSG